uniref:GCN5-like N-acetyltransferase n=1 Tax=Timspurckia oligopyrenoides TaxID=708627 RepID=UPI001FCD0DBA|nr:GCN5-like N-acetyltransferase [Timspurckia oligopyrenoides]UNJ17515.1 GCN5-like N-acetyltransferase [Timspurckia oligopyrenoides]
MPFWDKFLKNYSSLSVKSGKRHATLVIRMSYYCMHIYIYIDINKTYDLHELEKLCESVGWVKRPPKRIASALENSFMVMSLFYVHDTRKKTVGFVRVTSDSAFNATIWDFVIDPKFQGMGLGKTLMYYLVQQLRSYDISTITLFADAQVITFYEQLGFIADPSRVKGMFWYPKCAFCN